MNQHFFDITATTPILLYGAGEVGQLLKNSLDAKGYTLIGMIDAKIKTDDLLPVYELESLPLQTLPVDVVVVICLANGMIHSEIAAKLYKVGLQNLCYLPLQSSSIDRELFLKMIAAYNNLMGGALQSLKQIPSYDQLTSNTSPATNSLISDRGEFIIIWSHTNIVFTEAPHRWPEERDLRKVFITASKDRNIATFSTYRDLFSTFAGGDPAGAKNYCTFLASRGVSNPHQKLQEREQLYRLYQGQLNFGMEFFIETAPHAMWNERGYFNIVGGHHRTTFLYSQDNTYIPLKISRADYQSWSNTPALERFSAYLDTNKTAPFCTPIEHPAYMNLNPPFETEGKTIQSAIYELLSSTPFDNTATLDVSGYDGYFARNMCRSAKESHIDSVVGDIQLHKLLNDLLSLQGIHLYPSITDVLVANRMYDFVFLMKGMESHAFVLPQEKLLGKLREITGRYLFVEFASEQKNQKSALIRKIFENFQYQILGYQYHDGSRIEYGVYIHD